jgi:hypothetical protein
MTEGVTEKPQKAHVGCYYCGVYAKIEITDKDEDPSALVQYCPNCGKSTDVLEVYR